MPLDRARIEREARAAWAYLRPSTLPRATRTLILVFALVWIAELVVFLRYGTEGWERLFDLHREWWTQPWALVTSTLAHIPWPITYHLLPNIVGFWLVAPYVERKLGALKFTLLFLATGASATLAQVYLSSPTALGASGGITALVGWICADSRGSWRSIVKSPWRALAWIAGASIILASVLDTLSGPSRIGNVAHVGGLAIGFAVGLLTTPRPSQGSPTADVVGAAE